MIPGIANGEAWGQPGPGPSSVRSWLRFIRLPVLLGLLVHVLFAITLLAWSNALPWWLPWYARLAAFVTVAVFCGWRVVRHQSSGRLAATTAGAAVGIGPFIVLFVGGVLLAPCGPTGFQEPPHFTANSFINLTTFGLIGAACGWAGGKLASRGGSNRAT